MPWSVRGTYISATGNTNARALTVPAAVVVGDFLYAAFYWDASANNTTDGTALITPPAGWTEVARAENLLGGGASADFYHIAYYRIAQAGDPSTVYTWNNNGGTSNFWREGVMVAFAHSAGVVPGSGTIEDSDIVQSDTTATAWTAPASTSLNAGALHIISGSSWTGGSAAPPSGFSEAVDNASEVQVGWKELGAAGLSTPGLYDAGNDVWAAVSVIVKAPAAAAVVLPPRPDIIRQAVKRASSW